MSGLQDTLEEKKTWGDLFKPYTPRVAHPLENPAEAPPDFQEFHPSRDLTPGASPSKGLVASLGDAIQAPGKAASGHFPIASSSHPEAESSPSYHHELTGADAAAAMRRVGIDPLKNTPGYEPGKDKTAGLHFNKPSIGSSPSDPMEGQARLIGNYPPSQMNSTGAHGAYEASTVSPGREAALGESYDEQEHLAAHQGYTEAKAEERKAGAERNVAQAQMQGEDETRALAEARFQIANEQLAYSQRALDHLMKQPDIDQDRLWNNMSTAQQVGHTVAAGIVAFAMGWNHEQGQNPVVQQLNDRIERDVHAQEEAYRRKDKGWDQQNQLFTHAYALTGDLAAARKLAVDMGIQAAVTQAKAIEHSSAAPVMKAHAAQLVNEIEQKQILDGIKMHPMVQASAGKQTWTAEDEAKARKWAMEQQPKGQPIDPVKVQEAVNFMHYGLHPGHDIGAFGSPRGGPNADKLAARRETANSVRSEGEGIVNGPSGGSTNWNLERWIQNTDAAQRLRQNEAYNLDVLGFVKDAIGGRGSPEQIQAITDHFAFRPGDSADTLRKKLALFEAYQDRHLNVADSDTAAAPDETPEGFKPDSE